MKFVRSISDVFGYSPFEDLKRHAELSAKAVGLLEKQFEAYRRGNFNEVERLREEIDELEHKADIIKEEIRSRVTKSLLLPVDRQDLLRFLEVQDGIINYCEHVGHMMTFRKISAPENIMNEFEILLSKIMETVNEYEALIDHISRLIASSFTRREVEEALEHVKEVERFEHECDLIQIGLLNMLFNSDMNPIDIQLATLWVAHLGEIANYTARSADRFRIMVLGKD
jgi:predicted phosphate transport protein (TIGR00153 family)